MLYILSIKTHNFVIQFKNRDLACLIRHAGTSDNAVITDIDNNIVYQIRFNY